MLHAREDYNAIQDGRKLEDKNRIPGNEPVFLLRAQDKLSADIVDIWANCAKAEGAKLDIVNQAKEHANKMREWQMNVKCKTPNL